VAGLAFGSRERHRLRENVAIEFAIFFLTDFWKRETGKKGLEELKPYS
jgi:hypothetical protein